MVDVRRVRVLGPLAVDDREVPGARLRDLVVPLLLARGRALPAAVLRDAVWGLYPPADAHGALQALVSRARRTTGLPLEAVERGYRVPAAAVDVDALRVEDDLRAAREALRTGDVARAAAAARRGWAPLADAVALEALPADAAARLRGVRRDLLLVRADALVGTGSGPVPAGGAAEERPELLADLEAGVAGAPLDEPLAAALLRALVAVDRPGEALARYEEVRRAVDAYGAAPSGALRAAHAAALAATADPPSGRPAPGAAEAPGAASARPSETARALPGAAGPRVAEALLGRDADLAALDEQVRLHALVTLVGPGGVGKTTLVGSLLARRRAAGEPVREVPLAGLRSGADVLPAVLRALGGARTDLAGPDGTSRASAEEQLHRAATRATGLLVLDNCEHLLDAVADVALRVCAAAPASLHVLATSRAPLDVLGEHVRLLPPLDPDAAAELLTRRAAAVRPGLDLPADEVLRLGRRLDHLPLALELAAARLRTTGLADLLSALDQRADLSPGPRGLPERHRSLQALVGWSWDLLRDDERTLLARMAVFPAGASAATVVAVCADPWPSAERPAGAVGGLPAAAVPAALAGLVDASLVVWEPAADEGRGRYRLLETVREHADARCSPDERRTAQRRLAVWAAELAGALAEDLRGRGQLEALRRADSEHDALVAALRRATDDGDGVLAAPTGLLLVEAATLRGAHAEVLERLAALAACPSVLDAGARGERVRASLDGAGLARAWRQAAEVCAVGVPSAVGGGGPGAASRSLAVLASRLRRAARRPDLLGAGPAAATDLLVDLLTDPGGDPRAALDRLAAVDDPRWRGWGLFTRAWWLENGGLEDLGLADARAAHAVADGSGDVGARAVAAAFVAERLESSGDVAAGLVWWDRAERDYAAVGAAGDAGQARLSRLRVLAELGDPDADRVLREHVDRLAQDHPDDGFVALVVLADRVARARARGDLEDARALVASAVADLSADGRQPIPQLVASLEAAAALLALDAEDVDAASGHLGRAVAAALASGDVPAQAAVGEAVARWEALRGDDAAAGQLLALATRFGSRLQVLLGWRARGEAAPGPGETAARAVEELDGPAAVARLRELLGRVGTSPAAGA
ncbi:BTAD domain-containing putative transcriptional regulator [Pseudokineococcus sp. 5B2Z-1]|uniref:AfsR/SARP family transcriptional regulator n=1 Tax=Pseudokineococcus sp. 5B2Z-1 TaxID=3132744 RepID=UPI0030B3482C